MYSKIVQSNTCASDSIEPAISGSNSDCPLIVKTSKQWVLPPRPKPGRKPIPVVDCNKPKDKPKQKKPTKRIVANAPKIKQEIKSVDGSPITNAQDDAKSAPAIISSLGRNIKLIESENLALKTNLLSLIHDYKHLKNLVLNKDYNEPVEEEEHEKNVHKRTFDEVETKEEIEPVNELATNNLMNELINDMNDLSYDNRGLSEMIEVPKQKCGRKKKNYRKFNHYKDFDKLNVVEDSDLEIDFEDDDEVDDDEDNAHSPTFSSSTGLSRTTSPSSDFEGNSLMSTLTRSTTVSSVNTITNPIIETKKSSYPFKNSTRFFDMPKYEEETPDSYNFQFDDAMNLSSHNSQDQYNMVNDFLEEKLIINDLNYYVGDEYETNTRW